MTQFLLTTRTHWEESPRSRHQVASALAKKDKVYFLAGNKIGLPKIIIKKVASNIVLIVPYWFLNNKMRFRFPIINEIYQEWLFNKLKKRFKEHIVINFDHTYHLLPKFFKTSIYYCSDEFIGHSRYSNLILNKYHIYCENKIIRKSVLCIATADLLLEKLKKINPSSFEIKLGAPIIPNKNDYIHFNVREGNKIKVGFVGFIDNAGIKIQLLRRISQHPRMKLIIYGPYNKTKDYAFNPNTTFAGELKNEDLYDELKKIDVGIAAYSSMANTGTTPNKFWLYLSLGKPTVVTNLETIKNWNYPENYLYRANNDDEFIAGIISAYENDAKDIMMERKQFAQNNSWEVRIGRLKALIKKHIKRSVFVDDSR